MNRYCINQFESAEPQPKADGEWVKYSDVQSLEDELEEREEDIAKLREWVKKTGHWKLCDYIEGTPYTCKCGRDELLGET